MAEERRDISAAEKWIVAGTVLFGTFIVVMDVTVVNVAMPHMMGSFAQDMSSITWVATGYSIAEVITATMAAWWSTLLGRKRLYLLSFVIFTIGSVLAGTAHSFGQMVLYRVIQGFGGGSLIPVSQAIMRETFPPEEQGMAMAIYGMGVVLAPAAGPVVGGWLIDHYGWPWIFYINVPISIAGILLVSAFVFDPPYLRRGVKTIDWLGIILLGVTLTVMQVVLERGQRENWLESHWIVAGIIVVAVAGLLLVLHELRVPDPIVHFRLFTNRPLAVGSGMIIAFGVALYGTTFILPQFTQQLLGYPAFEAGLVLAPRALAVMVVMPLVGWLYRLVDARALMIFGMLIMAWAYYDLAHLTLQVGFWNIVPALLILGTGMPFMYVTLTTISLSSIPLRDMTSATSLATLAQRIGGNVGYALMATLVANYTQVHRAFLVKNVSPVNPIYERARDAAATQLYARGLDPSGARVMAETLINSTVNTQAAMLAYNDASLILGVMILCLIPFAFLMPGRPGIRPTLAGE